MKLKGYKYLVFLALIAVNILLYASGMSNNFINLDDSIYVINNIKVQSISLDNFAWAFKSIYFGHYSPLLWISYMIDYSLGEGNALIFHIHNLIIHILNVWLIFLCTNIILNDKTKAICTSLFFSVLALNVEPVLWVSSRKDLLSAFYFFLAMYFYLLHCNKHSKIYYVCSFLAIIFGTLVKSSVVFFVFITFLIDYLLLCQKNTPYSQLSFRNKIKSIFFNIFKKLPFIIIFFVSLFLGYFTQKYWGAIYNYRDLTIINRIFNAAVYIINYLRRVFYPSDLSIIYDHPYDNISIALGLSLISGLLIIFSIIFKYRKKNPISFFCAMFFIFTIAPYLQLSQIGIQAMADRWCYISKYAVTLFMFSFKKKHIYPLVILVSLVNIYFGIPYIKAWKSDISLYEYTLNNNYQSHVVYRLLAKSYNSQADSEKDYKKYKEKIFNNIVKSLDKNILDIESVSLFTDIIGKSGNKHNELYKKIIDNLFVVRDDKVDSKKLKAIALTYLADSKFAISYIREKYKVHPLELANDYLSEAMERDKDNLELFIAYLRVAYYAKIQKAVVTSISKLFPNSQRTMYILGYDAYLSSDFDKAISILTKFVEINPSSCESYAMVAKSYMEKNDYVNAKKYINYALKSSNNHPSYKAMLYEIMINEGKKNEVINKIQKDILLKNYNTNTLKIIADLYEENKQYRKALNAYHLALNERKSPEIYDNIAKIYSTLNCKHLFAKYHKLSVKIKNRIKHTPLKSQLINVIIKR